MSRAWIPHGEKAVDFQRRRKRSYPRLKSLIFVAVPTGFSHERFQFYDVREDCKLTTLWSNILDINCSELKNCELRSLSWNSPKIDGEIHPGIHLEALESFWEPKPILMKSIKAPTKLKLLQCYFDPEVVYLSLFHLHLNNLFDLVKNFQNFCRFCPLIEVLKLDTHDERASPLVWNNESWKNLSRLRVLSMQATLIGIYSNNIMENRMNLTLYLHYTQRSRNQPERGSWMNTEDIFFH